MEGDYEADLALSVLQLHAHSDLLHAHLLLHRLRAAITDWPSQRCTQLKNLII